MSRWQQRSQAAGGAGGAAGGGGARPLSEAERPFGLPKQLRLDALARRRGRVLRARSDRYLHTLYTVAVFYALPVVQFVAAFQIVSASARRPGYLQTNHQKLNPYKSITKNI